MLETVGEAFLDDAVGRQVDTRWKLHGTAFNSHGHRKAGGSNAPHERVQVAQAGLGSQLGRLPVRTDDSQQPAQLRHLEWLDSVRRSVSM